MVGRLEVLEDAVLELLLLRRAQLTRVVSLLERALAAHRHHRVDELGVALHCDSLLVHVCGSSCVLRSGGTEDVWVELILYYKSRTAERVLFY